MPDAPVPELDLLQVGLSLAVDLAFIVVFAIAIYYRRHARKDLAMVFAVFNICLFVVITVIQATEVAAALGFGLFAILSIIRLRSEPFDNREIGYFFGALVLGLLNGIGTTHLALTVGLNALVVGSVYLFDHPRVLRSAERRHVTLDAIHTDAFMLEQVLSSRLGATIIACNVTSIDYVQDSMEVEVQLRSHRPHLNGPLDQATAGSI